MKVEIGVYTLQVTVVAQCQTFRMCRSADDMRDGLVGKEVHLKFLRFIKDLPGYACEK